MATASRRTKVVLIMVVAVILGLSWSCSRSTGKLVMPKHVKASCDVAAIAGVIRGYALENDGRYPKSLEVLVTPDERGFTYLARNTVPLDPWGNPYVFEPPALGTNRFRVVSYGQDGKPGGTMEDADIDSLQVERGGNRGQE